MRRLTGFVICLSMLIALAGCGRSAEIKPSDVPEAQKERSIEELKEQCPEAFALSPFKGVEVFVWETADGTYRCGMISGTNRMKTAPEIRALEQNSLSVAEAKTVLKEIGVENDRILVIPITQPYTNPARDENISEPYLIDEEHAEQIYKLFTPTGTMPQEEAPSDSGPFVPAGKATRVNYSEDRRIFETCLNAAVISETMHLSSVRHLPLFRFDSRSDLDQFIADDSDLFRFHEGYAGIPSFDETVSAYDEGFFSERCLLCVYLVSGSGSFRYGVKDVQKDGPLLCINVEQINRPQVYTADMAGWLLLVEAKKSDLQACREFDALFVGTKQEEA